MTRPKPDPETLFVVKKSRNSHHRAVFTTRRLPGYFSDIMLPWRDEEWEAEADRNALIAAYECGWLDQAEWTGAEKPKESP